MTEPTLDLCPLCGRKPDDVGWVDEQEQFLVDCPQCMQYTITLGMANRFRCLLEPDECRMGSSGSRATCAKPATTMIARSPKNRGFGWPPKRDLYISA